MLTYQRLSISAALFSRSAMTSLRSSRRDAPRKRYTIDAFEGIEELVLASDEHSGSEAVEQDAEEDEDDPGSFHASAESVVPSDGEMSGIIEIGAVEEIEDDADSNAGEHDLDDSISIADDPDGPISTPKQRGKRKVGDVHNAELETYTRGVLDQSLVHNRMSKRKRRLHYFGPTKDWSDLWKARAKWGYEVCYPNRKQKKDGSGGFAYTAAYNRELAKVEVNWKWYHEGGGKEGFKKRLVVSALSQADAQAHLPHDGEGVRSVVMGPVDQQRLYHLQPRQFLPLATSFEYTPQLGQKWTRTLPKDYKTGYLINLGARVQSLDWAPSQLGSKHFLAVAVIPERDAAEDAPAFSPQPDYESSIQIWEFTADATGHIAIDVSPKLRKVICTSVGDIKSLKWCPVPAQQSAVLGFLAFISGDGAVRVIAVGRTPSDDSTGYVLVEKYAFEARPPNTMCSAITWLSSTRLAVACANGCLGVWDIAESLKSPNPNPRPVIYGSLSPSYIIDMTSGWPSHPHMLMTTSMNGYEMITDLSKPSPFTPCETALSHRSRMGQPIIKWNEFIKCALSGEDNHLIRAYPLRRWFGTIGLLKAKSHVSCLAVSPCHPFVLTGTVGGDVLGNNPVRRVADGSKTTLWMQTWFSHEWRRPTEEERSDARRNATDSSSPAEQTSIGRSGLTRIVEGFKAEKVTLQNNASIPSSNSMHGKVYTTIYEAKTAISAVAWNPNLHVAGWAAAGMADGLLRVEDIAG